MESVRKGSFTALKPRNVSDRVPQPRTSAASSEAGTLYVYDDRNIQQSVRVMLTALSAILLLLPIIILFFIGTGYPALIVIIVCTVLFSVILVIVTDAQDHEIMVAAAA